MLQSTTLSLSTDRVSAGRLPHRFTYSTLSAPCSSISSCAQLQRFNTLCFCASTHSTFSAKWYRRSSGSNSGVGVGRGAMEVRLCIAAAASPENVPTVKPSSAAARGN